MVLLWGLLATTSLVINEVLYDPSGTDGGAEFVEIYNAGEEAVALAGSRLEFANGTGAVQWLIRWEAAATDSLGPGQCFLIVDSGWQGVAAAVEVTLALQNGPDAIRLVRPDGSVDRIGWGDLTDETLFEGAPAPDVSGRSLIRRPDGHDTDHNAHDLLPADPTPGESNWPVFAPRVLNWSWQPPVVEAPGLPIELRVELRNDGREDLAGHGLGVDLGGVWSAAILPTAAPDSTLTVAVPCVPDRSGAVPVKAWIWSEARAETVAVALGHYQVGPAAFALAEVMAAPNDGGEWCEIINRSPVPRSLAAMQLRDEDGTWRGLPDLVLAPGDCQLVAQDPAALTSWLDELAAAGMASPCEVRPVVGLAGWPSLNNTNPDSRLFADRLYLAWTDGTVIDHVTLGLGTGRAPQGRSLERQPDRHWRPATAPAGATPGCPPPDPLAVAPGEVRLTPNPFARDAGDGALHAYLDIPADAVGYELRCFDLWGGVVRDLGGDDLGPGPRDVVWDGCDEAGRPLPAGGYVVIVRWREASGATRRAARRLVVMRAEQR